jgi:O-antigen/teichoic acid export membrane protein
VSFWWAVDEAVKKAIRQRTETETHGIRFTYQSAMLFITQVPYNAVIIAHEKMSIYAYLDILGVTLRLLILYLLVIGDFDKLILYSILSLSVSILMMSLYRIYCIRHYPESHFHFVWRKDILKPMLGFSGWDLYGNLSNMARTQGVIVLVNMFFGLVANAAVSIAFTVQSIVMKFTSGVSTAVRPQIVKTFSVGDYDRMSTLIYMSAKYLYLLLLLVSVPVFMETHFILELWLKIVPDFTVWLVRWMIIFNFWALMSLVMAMGIHATGKVKRISLINGTLYLSVIPVSYVLYKLYGNLYSAFIYNALAVCVGCLCNVYTLGLTVKQITLGRFAKKVLLPIALITVVAFAVAYLPRLYFQEGFIRFLIVGFASTIVIFGITYTTAEAEVQELIKKRILKYVKFGKHTNSNL